VVEIEWSNSTFLINNRRNPRETFVEENEIAFKRENKKKTTSTKSTPAIKSTESTIRKGT